MRNRKDITDPLVSVIIPVFNDARGLEICLRALRAQTLPPSDFEIIVVDNNSDEDLAALTRPLKNLKLFSEEQKGSYAARNRGVRAARGEILAFTDADCLPAADWLEKGVKRLSGDPSVSLVGGQVELFFADENKPTAVELFESLTYFDQKHFVENLHFSATANLFTRRGVFEQAGFFAADLRSGGDYEWGRRVFEKGFRLIYAGEVRVKHPARRTVRDLLERRRRIRGGAWQLARRGVEWVNPHELSLFLGLIPPLRRSIQLWRNRRLPGVREKLKMIGLENLAHYVQWAEMLRLFLGGDPKR
jgi:glycosyltransferase involved in cell wall biosynthesis